MADADDVRRLALALPVVVEIESDGFDFRVGGHGFIWSYPERRPGHSRSIRTDIAVLFVGDEAEKQALLLGEPDIFFTTPGYDGSPLVMVRLAELGEPRLTITSGHRRLANAGSGRDGRGPRRTELAVTVRTCCRIWPSQRRHVSHSPSSVCPAGAIGHCSPRRCERPTRSLGSRP